MKIFVSYPAAQESEGRELEAALQAQRHKVLSAAAGVRQEGGVASAGDAMTLSQADLLIFLISPAAVRPGSNTMAHLQRAQGRWPKPKGHVLAVPVQATPWSDIPDYLRQCARVRAHSGVDLLKACLHAVGQLKSHLEGKRPLVALSEGPSLQAHAKTAAAAAAPIQASAQAKRPAWPSQAKPTAQDALHDGHALPQPLAAKAAVRKREWTPLFIFIASLALLAALWWGWQRMVMAGSGPGGAPRFYSGLERLMNKISAKREERSQSAATESSRPNLNRTVTTSAARSGAAGGPSPEYGAVAALGRSAPEQILLPAAGGSPARATPVVAYGAAPAVLEALGRCQQGYYASAFEQLRRLTDATPVPANQGSQLGLQDCAMQWLRDAQVRVGETSFFQLVKPLRPVLEGALQTASSGQRSADLRAHLGWADYLLGRDQLGAGPDPSPAYEAALKQDPHNVYANTMLAVWKITQAPQSGEMAAQANAHLGQALSQPAQRSDGGLSRAFARRAQIVLLAAVQEYREPILQAVNEARREGSVRDSQTLESAWYHLFAEGSVAKAGEQLLKALPPADALATLVWCMPAEAVPALSPNERQRWRYLHGLLLTQLGRHAQARLDLTNLGAEVKASEGSSEFSRAVDRLLAQK